MTESSLIVAEAPSVAEMRSKVQEWLRKVVETQCKEYEEITKIADLGLYRKELDTLRQELTRVKLPSLAETVTASLAQLEKNAALLQTRQQELGIQTEISLMRTSAPLKDLLQFRERLSKYENLSKETKKIRDTQLAAIEKEIECIEDTVENGEKKLEQLDSKQALAEWKNTLSALAVRTEGTQFVRKLEKVLDSAAKLGNYFDELWIVENTPLRTEEDVTNAKSRLVVITKTYTKVTSDKQKKVAEKVETSVDHRVREYEQQALLLVDQLEEAFAKGTKLGEIRAKLEHPIPFLPEKAEKRISSLKQKIDKRLDEDVILQIEISFRKIKDNKTRRDCIKRLSEIAEE